jgi:hypothetical protein
MLLNWPGHRGSTDTGKLAACMKEFKHALSRALVPGFNPSNPSSVDCFLPRSALAPYFADRSRLEDLLEAVVDSNAPPVDTSLLSESYLTVFSILVLLGRGGLIADFIRNENFCDDKLPFSADTGAQWPTSSGFDLDPDVIRRFCDIQWIFLPHNFGINDGVPVLEPERVLPITNWQQVAENAFATVTEITIHPAHHNYARRDSAVSTLAMLDTIRRLTLIFDQ